MGKSEFFTNWLQDEIDNRGWNKSTLARATGLSRQTISNVLSKRRAPGQEFCNAIAAAFGCDPAIVFQKAGLLPNAIQSDRAGELAFKFSLLSSEQQDALMMIADSFIFGNSADRRKQ